MSLGAAQLRGLAVSNCSAPVDPREIQGAVTHCRPRFLN